MPEKDQYEYAVIRIVPQVEREEFLNVGVVLYCAKHKFLQCRYHFNEERVLALFPDLDILEMKLHLHSFEQICAGDPEAGPIARLGIAERFRWLTATRSTVLQTSKVHPGLCSNPESMLDRIYAQQVS
jgi:hypothetical protein